MIVPMARVQVLGPRAALAPTLAALQRRGVLQLRASEEQGADGSPLVRPLPLAEGDEALAKALDRVADRAEAIAARLPRGAGGEPEPLPPPGDPALEARLAALEEELSSLEARRSSRAEEREALARFERLVVALAPIRPSLDPALAPEIHGLFLDDDPEAIALLAREVARITEGRYELRTRPIGEGSAGVLLIVPRAASKELAALLFAHGVEEVRLPAGLSGRPLVEVLLRVAERLLAIPGEVDAIDAGLLRLARSFGGSLAEAAIRAREAAARLRAAGRCGATRFAFVVAGWTPSDAVEGLRAGLALEVGECVVLLARPPRPSEWPGVPVLLSNPPWLRPFQLLLALVPLPRYGSVDPTPWLAAFFPLFFGFVLGDAAFGLLAGAAAALAHRRGWGGRMGRDVAAVALACAGSAFLFGLLFGEALGDLGAAAGMRPLLFHRRIEVLEFLALAVAVGGAHVLVGGALGLSTAVRAGHRREAIARGARLGILAAGGAAVLAVAGAAPRPSLVPALAALGVFVAVAVVAEGPMALLDVVLGLGNVLSYSRLMALGLASAMLADVANAIARTLGPRAAGVGIGLLLHLVNFSLGLVSPVVAALRLHYVEFFERFYEEGGEPFRPFALTG